MTETRSLMLDTTSHRARKWYWRVVRFPLVRLVIAIFVVGFASFWPSNLILGAFGVTLNTAPAGVMCLAVAVTVSGGVLAYWLLVKFIEWRTLDELSMKGAVKELGLGVLTGVGLLSVVMGIIALFGGYRISGMNSPSVLLFPLAMGVMTGTIEEIIARGILYRIVEEWLGTWISMLLSAALFGLAHAGNPNATVFSSIAIAISAGPLLAGAFSMTRRLWMVIGIHFAWNFTLGGVFGAPVSGNPVEGLFQSELSDTIWLTGGDFGPELSVLTPTLCLVLAVWFFAVAMKRKHIVKAFWNRRGGD